MRIRRANLGDAAALRAIYAPFVTDTPVSLELDAPSLVAFTERIAGGGDSHPWLVAEEKGAIAAYAYAGRFRPREGYRYTAEVSVYVAPAWQRRGLARALYTPLIDLLAAQNYTQAIAAITVPNDPSVGLHEAFGFERCALYRQVGWKLGRWWDVGLWQRPLAPARTPPEPLRPLSAVWAAPVRESQAG